MRDTDSRQFGTDVDFAGGIAGHDPSSDETFSTGMNTHYAPTGTPEELPNPYFGAEGFAGGIAGHDTGEIPKLTPEMLGIEL